jgi:phenylacetate-coenzyme A ligase PaaK-like adenylate-forming protein
MLEYSGGLRQDTTSRITNAKVAGIKLFGIFGRNFGICTASMINKVQDLKQAVLNIRPGEFNELAVEIFGLQYELNPVYRQFVSMLGLKSAEIKNWRQIPCMPISFFKNHRILLDGLHSERQFKSSGTTGQIRSIKHIPDPIFYKEVARKIFEQRFGRLEDYVLFALLPSYMENDESSLIFMINDFLDHTGSKPGGFYKDDYVKLINDIKEAHGHEKKTMLWGVSFALTDLAEGFETDLSDVLVFETGGMKGRKKELTRAELHETIRKRTGAREIYSEYGMTELMSQAYSDGTEKFISPDWIKLNAMEINDPLSGEKFGRIGTLNIIDLANVETCSFIATEDLGRVYEDGSFEVLGRKDHAEIRGCNLLMN